MRGRDGPSRGGADEDDDWAERDDDPPVAVEYHDGDDGDEHSEDAWELTDHR